MYNTGIEAGVAKHEYKDRKSYLRWICELGVEAGMAKYNCETRTEYFRYVSNTRHAQRNGMTVEEYVAAAKFFVLIITVLYWEGL